MAFLLIDESATAIWENISNPVASADRPAFLDQTDGVGWSKASDGLQLIEIANRIKDDLDMSRFQSEHIGAEAALSMRDITPSTASFASPEELFSLHTKFVNLHDTLLVNLDCSGSSAAEGTLERRFLFSS